MSIDDDTLMAYADGELAPHARAEVALALEGDAELRARLAAHERMRRRFSAAYDGALDEPVPERLLAAAAKSRGADIVDLGARRGAKWSAREWGAIAASLAAGLLIAFNVSGRETSPFSTTDGKLSAGGALARALDSQLAADAGTVVKVGLSFRNRDGQYCRTFDLAGANTAGLACRDETVWRIAVASAHGAGGGEVRQAGSEVSPAILGAIESMIDGDALGPDEEAQARAEHWRSQEK